MHEEMLNIPGHKGNANQNNTEVPPHPVRMTFIKKTSNKCCDDMTGAGEEHLCTIGWNVN
jgi:hypothetical protein